MIEFEKMLIVRKDVLVDAEKGEFTIVGKGEHNCVLLSYTTVRIGEQLTAITEYNLDTHQNTELYCEEGICHVSSASIDATKSILGYTLREDSEEGYQTYITRIVEINPVRRVFRLGEKTWELQRLMFLPKLARSADAEAYFLFFMHHKKIILYKCDLKREQYISVTSQPQATQIADSFSWAQVDFNRSLLYYANFTSDISFQSQSTTSTTPEAATNGRECNNIQKLQLTALYFQGDALGKLKEGERSQKLFVIDFRLPLNYELSFRELKYSPRQLTTQVADNSFNLAVLTLDNGTFCLCVQYTGLFWEEPAGNKRKLEYGVFMLHNCHSIHCQVPVTSEGGLESPLICVSPIRMQFIDCNGLILVYAPGLFLHSLNCSSEFELYHHIVAVGGMCPRFPGGKEQPMDILEGRSGYNWVLTPNDSVIYRVRFTSAGLIQMFEQTTCKQNILGLISIALLFVKFPELITGIFSILTQRSQDLILKDIYTEYLLATPYAGIRNTLPNKVKRYLPVTDVSAFYHMENYKEFDKIIATFVTNRIGKVYGEIFNIPEGVCKMLDIIKNNFYLYRYGRPRFNPKNILQGYLNGDGSILKMHNNIIQQQQSGLMKKKGFLSFLNFGRINLTPISPISPTLCGDEQLVPYLDRDGLKEEGQGNLLMCQILWQKLFQGLSTYIAVREGEETVDKIVMRYVKLQHEASCNLLKCILNSFNIKPDEDPLLVPMGAVPTQISRRLYNSMEKYYTAVRELSYTLPKGFDSTYACLAVRHLTPQIFIRFTEQELITLTDYFMSKMESDHLQHHNAPLYRQIVSLRESRLSGDL